MKKRTKKKSKKKKTNGEWGNRINQVKFKSLKKIRKKYRKSLDQLYNGKAFVSCNNNTNENPPRPSCENKSMEHLDQEKCNAAISVEEKELVLELRSIDERRRAILDRLGEIRSTISRS